MKTYRRILVPIPSGAQGDILLQRAAGLTQAPHAQMLVVRVLDTRSGFDPDGPAALLPDEAAARRSPDVKKRLDLQLARNNLGWAESKVVWGEPQIVLADVIRNWAPDLVVACANLMPRYIAEDADILTVACRSLLWRLAGALNHHAPRHA